MSPALLAYRLLTRWLEPWAPRVLDARVRSGKEDAQRVDERLGVAGVARPEGPLVWLHGVSVGETLSLLPVVERLRAARPDLNLLVTSGTVTSARLLAQRLPAGVIHQFAPVDGPRAVAGFLDHWRPTLGILVESELWPNLIRQAKARGVALALISARVTERTAKGWRRVPGAARELLSAFDLILPQDPASAERLAILGARIDGELNLKLSGEPLPHDKGAFARLSQSIGDRPVVVAASTHPGEEMFIVRALDGLSDRMCLVILPRHPERGREVSSLLARDGYAHALRSRGEAISVDTDIYVADTLGEMGLFLRLADVVVMGGSFASLTGQTPLGGHNPLEPARLSKPVICGPDVANWQGVSALMTAADALVIARSPSELSKAAAALLRDPQAGRAMGERARKAAQEAGAGLDRLMVQLSPLLPASPGRRK